MPSSVLGGSCPYTCLFKSVPDYSLLRIFGCLVYPHLRLYNSHKLQFRSAPCTFLGYSSNHKGYNCLDKNGRLFVVRNAVFDETVFPFAASLSIVLQVLQHLSLSRVQILRLPWFQHQFLQFSVMLVLLVYL
ncbi:hypothetical protein ACOSQ3_024925 [Xanthoceras sorbifolium]